MSDASKFMTNEASNHNNESPLSIQSLPWSPLFKCNEGKNETCVATNLIP
jgi:hypothetical protein